MDTQLVKRTCDQCGLPFRQNDIRMVARRVELFDDPFDSDMFRVHVRCIGEWEETHPTPSQLSWHWGWHVEI